MNSINTRRATAFACAAVATLTMLAVTDALFTPASGAAVTAAGTPATQATQAVVITGQRAARG